MPKRIIFAVTNDLVFDQRMQRICSSMAAAGYAVTLVGREKKQSPPLRPAPYEQVRLRVRHEKGKRFYVAYNLALYRFLLTVPADAFCAIDLDTIVPVYLASKRRKLPRMYDAHEFFTEMIEVVRRPAIHFAWKCIEKWLVPRFRYGYTVGQAIARDFEQLYGVKYAVVRNVPFFREPPAKDAVVPETARALLGKMNAETDPALPLFLYQGALNEGRALPQLLDAMTMVPARLVLAGSGNLETIVRERCARPDLQGKVMMCGDVSPADLPYLTAACFAGITIFDALSKNQYYSLGNKFFDYIMAGRPQVCVLYPEYVAILARHPVAQGMENTQPDTIARAMNKLLENPVLYAALQQACEPARQELNWNREEKILLECWENLLKN